MYGCMPPLWSALPQPVRLLWKVVRTSRRGVTERGRQEELGEFRLKGRSDIELRMGLLRWDYGGVWAGRICGMW